MSYRIPILLLSIAFLAAGAVGAGELGAVAIRVLDEPVEDLRAYSEEVVSSSQRTAPTTSLNAVAGRSTSTSDVLLVPY
ncbi:MAG TPA: hypothetical protein VMR44_09095, partial [Thermoanaerobaculia bacterium]|nr:hypothetical protein [Thermoanaerobaculia bacterium]